MRLWHCGLGLVCFFQPFFSYFIEARSDMKLEKKEAINHMPTNLFAKLAPFVLIVIMNLEFI